MNIKPVNCAHAIQAMTLIGQKNSCSFPIGIDGLGPWREIIHESISSGMKCSGCEHFIEVREKQAKLQNRENWI